MHRGYQSTYVGMGGMYKYLISRPGCRIRKAVYDSDHWILYLVGYVRVLRILLGVGNPVKDMEMLYLILEEWNFQAR